MGTLLKRCTLPNLWATHPPFQIDGNFGGTAGIAEMLLQSHEGYIHLMPALPEEWKNGSFEGLCARKGFVVCASWKDGIVIEIKVRSNLGGKLKILCSGIWAECETKKDETVIWRNNGFEFCS